jgi:hypothetical protein
MLNNFLAAMNQWVDWLATEYGAAVIGFGALLYLIAHLRNFNQERAIQFSWFMLVGAATIFVLLSFRPQEISFGRILSLLVMYGVALFALLSTYMRRGWAGRLTRWRGDKWVKELDYIYLTLALAGIIASVNRLPFVTRRIDIGDVFAPVLLTTAVVIRFIKTRADIGGWNKEGA